MAAAPASVHATTKDTAWLEKFRGLRVAAVWSWRANPGTLAARRAHNIFEPTTVGVELSLRVYPRSSEPVPQTASPIRHPVRSVGLIPSEIHDYSYRKKHVLYLMRTIRRATRLM